MADSGIVTLMERINDDNETFTAEEVRRIRDFTMQCAIDDIYNNARVATMMQESRERAERDRALAKAMIASIGGQERPKLVSIVRQEVRHGTEQEA
ncbi:MAG: hypothetical protein IKF78_13105 [Atopobiaceae bacterium]|nr:hypothetical protein [Atopobiaceae bacterium]